MNGELVNLDMLPDIRLRIDDAHIRLVCSPIHQSSVVHLQERVTGIVLHAGFKLVEGAKKLSAYRRVLSGGCTFCKRYGEQLSIQLYTQSAGLFGIIFRRESLPGEIA